MKKEKENQVREQLVDRSEAYNYYANVLCRMFKANPKINVGFSEVVVEVTGSTKNNSVQRSVVTV